MNGDILAVGVENSYLHEFLHYARQEGRGLVIPAYNVTRARQLLLRQKFLAVLIDLDNVPAATDDFWHLIKLYRLPVFVLGREGTRYSWPVEQAVERFFSYSISPKLLCTQITSVLYATGENSMRGESRDN